MTTINLDEVQGIVFSGYNTPMARASYYLLRITDSTKTKVWIKDMVASGQVSGGDEKKYKSNDSPNRLNLAISYPGFCKLEKDEAKRYSFELSFREGMNSEHRSALLGDRGPNDPEQWSWGNGDKEVDILLILFSKDDAIHSDSCSSLEKGLEAAGLSLIERLDAGAQVKNQHGKILEHFGFADGISDPLVDGFPTVSGRSEIATGEFLLGYPNQYDGKKTQMPVSEQFGANGTYLVLRQLKQNVGDFWQFIKDEAKRQDVSPDYLAAKFVGRWKSGAVVQPGQTQDPNTITNNFTFANDKNGTGCPFGSHIRRANPRGVGLGESEAESLKVASRHRILRRGRSYGSFLKDPSQGTGEDERGLLFICLNANIERQFEFIQHTWINNVKFAGLYDEDDPLIGSAVETNRKFTIQDEPLRRRVCGFQQFVTTRGGAYFFLPSMTALGKLAQT